MTWTRMKLALLSGGLAVAGISCDSQPVADVPDDRTGESAIPAPGDARTRAPSPDAARLSFDESTQVLQLYDLPEQGGYWMVALPAEPRGVPMQGDFKFTKRNIWIRHFDRTHTKCRRGLQINSEVIEKHRFVIGGDVAILNDQAGVAVAQHAIGRPVGAAHQDDLAVDDDALVVDVALGAERGFAETRLNQQPDLVGRAIAADNDAQVDARLVAQIGEQAEHLEGDDANQRHVTLIRRCRIRQRVLELA